jgi:hypothetical protein
MDTPQEELLGFGYRATFFHFSFYTARPVPAREKGIRKKHLLHYSFEEYLRRRK